MCGIYGIISLCGNITPDAQVLKRMEAVTIHRGPDDSGVYIGEEIAIGMRRLSIIDVVGGHQPLSNQDETLWLVCNGEIYNFRELRDNLKAKGYLFKSGSDSEVIIHLYAEYGDDFISRLNGMYAFALWDVKRRRLVIGRDRLGIKPLYYYIDNQRFIFATEAKAILEVPDVRTELDSVALESYLALGYVPTPYSIFAGIKKLPMASLMVVENAQVQVRTYWKLPTDVDHSLSDMEWKVAVRDRLEAAVRAQMISDVPIGAFLSGGIDSSAVVAFMSKYSEQPVKTYSIGFHGDKAGDYYNELSYARQIAEKFNTDHREIIVKPDVVKLLPHLLWHMDEPMADAAFITTYLVAEFARRDVTVILCGVGGDELFGGYHRYLGEYYSQFYRRLPICLRKNILQKFANYLPSDRHSAFMNLSRYMRSFILSAELPCTERYRSYVQVFSDDLRQQLLSRPVSHSFDALGVAFSEADQSDSLNYLLEIDILTQLPDDLLLLTDKMTMATSLECRVPFLDHDLVELSARIPGEVKIRGRELKHILKRSLVEILPNEIIHRKKRGFGAPVGAWLKQDLAPLLKKVLCQETIERRGLFNWRSVHNTVVLHETNRGDYTDHLLALMNLELWSRLYLDKCTPEDLTEELRELVH